MTGLGFRDMNLGVMTPEGWTIPAFYLLVRAEMEI